MNKSRAISALGLVGALLVAGCTGGDDAAETTTAATQAAATTPEPVETTPAPVETTATPVEETVAPTVPDTVAEDPFAGIEGDAPGVSDEAIKIGVTYVDVEALKAVGLDFNLGPFEEAYTAYADFINANGGINGRNLELVFAPVDPTRPESAEAACVGLTEDEDVFIITGYWRGDAVACPTDVHATAVVGGTPNPDLQGTAKAPWITSGSDAEVRKFVIRSFAESGALEGTVGVIGHITEQAEFDDAVATLDELGIAAAEAATIDSPTDDRAATDAAVKAIAERFKAKGVDVVLLAGAAAGNQWPTAMHTDSSYRPSLRFTAYNAPQAFVGSAANAGADFTILDGSLIGGLYGPPQAIWEEAGMQECFAVLNEIGIDAPAPNTTTGVQGDQPYQASFETCQNLTVVAAWAGAAGANLNYGTLAAVLDNGLEVLLPGDPKPRMYGTGGAADGDPAAFVFTWDSAAQAPVLSD